VGPQARGFPRGRRRPRPGRLRASQVPAQRSWRLPDQLGSACRRGAGPQDRPRRRRL